MDIDRPVEAATRIQRLKALTDSSHRSLDGGIMAAQPFADRERYALFLEVQHRFHADVAPLYHSPDLGALLPDLSERCRLDEVRQDIHDVTGKPAAEWPSEAAGADLPTALGWLYVAEGSNLGAAFLIKEAARLGFSEEFGARHLAGHPEGRGLHWRNFVAAFNALDLSEPDEGKVAEGAKAAFSRVHRLVDDIFGRPRD